MILDLISDRSVTRQDELARMLGEKGFEVTQASVSRDLDELGVVKISGKYVRMDEPKSVSSPFGISSIDMSGENLLVVRCAAGLASAAAVRIDAEEIGEIVGTLAGDDTIFVAVRDAAGQRAAAKKLKVLFS